MKLQRVLKYRLYIALLLVIIGLIAWFVLDLWVATFLLYLVAAILAFCFEEV